MHVNYLLTHFLGILLYILYLCRRKELETMKINKLLLLLILFLQAFTVCGAIGFTNDNTVDHRNRPQFLWDADEFTNCIAVTGYRVYE